MDRLERNLVISMPIIFIFAVIYLYLFPHLVNSGPTLQLFERYPWIVVILAWEVAVIFSARAYLKAWDEMFRRAGG